MPGELSINRQSIDDRYRILRRLDDGDMGRRYLAEARQAPAAVLLTIIRADLIGDDCFVGQFRNEMRLCPYPNHPNMVTVHEYGVAADDRLFIATEHLEGRSLDDLLQEGPLDVRTALWLGRQIAAGLAFAQQCGVPHSGVRPRHVTILDREPAVKLPHFGITRLRRAAATAGRIGSRDLIGVAEHMAPEQIMGDAITERADVYTLGTILYHMLVGTPPFSGDTPWVIFTKHLREIPAAVIDIRADVPLPLHTLIMQAMGKSPDARPRSMREMLEILGGIDGVGPMPTVLPSRVESLPDDLDPTDQISPTPVPPTAGDPPPQRLLLKRAVVALGVLVLAAASAAVVETVWRPPAISPPSRRADDGRLPRKQAQTVPPPGAVPPAAVRGTARGELRAARQAEAARPAAPRQPDSAPLPEPAPSADVAGLTEAPRQADVAPREAEAMPPAGPTTLAHVPDDAASAEQAATPRIRPEPTPPETMPSYDVSRLRTAIEQKLRGRGLLRETPADRWGVTIEIDADLVVTLAGTLRDQRLVIETVGLTAGVPGVTAVRPNIAVLEQWQSP